jgi:hypothetical protein
MRHLVGNGLVYGSTDIEEQNRKQRFLGKDIFQKQINNKKIKPFERIYLK